MLVYPAHHVLNTDSPSRLLLLLFSYGAGVICLATAREYRSG